MIDKEKYTSFIKDVDTRNFIIKNISKIEGVLKHYDTRVTSFMDPYQQKCFRAVLNAFSDDISYEVFGGNENSERKLFVIFPYYESEIKNPLKLLRLKGNFKFEKITHRDCLGALMSLGIVREKIGDICLNDDFVDVVIDSSIDNFMVSNIESVRRCSVTAEILPVDQFCFTPVDLSLKVVSVSSLRIDNVVSEAFNLSRSSALSLVKAQRVNIDYEPVFMPSREAEENSLISVRGYGRVVLKEILGYSKKGKIRIKLGYYK